MALLELELFRRPNLIPLRIGFVHIVALGLELQVAAALVVVPNLERVKGIALKVVFPVQIHHFQRHLPIHVESSGVAPGLFHSELCLFLLVLRELLLLQLVHHRYLVVCGRALRPIHWLCHPCLARTRVSWQVVVSPGVEHVVDISVVVFDIIRVVHLLQTILAIRMNFSLTTRISEARI